MNTCNSHKSAILMRGCLCLSFFWLCVSCAPLETPEKIPERSMGVTAGPDKVFEKPVGEILSPLAGATATGINGRVGNELVFWGYRLQDNSDVNFFACALLEDVDCESRLGAICPAGGQELARVVEPGNVRRLDCRPVGMAGVGDLQPNCSDNERSYDLLVGLMQCP